MTYFTRSQLSALESTATAAASYLDACDGGAQYVQLDPRHYRECGKLLGNIFSLVDPRTAFPMLVQQSAAAREAVETIRLNRELRLSRLVYYPELTALINRVTA